ncbi:MAG: hypothetical protein IAE81_07025 [Caldilineaceae bacterium]|jgi:hypothetical protein|nr:hypothetical protein [Caldilineaceae bacterium]
MGPIEVLFYTVVLIFGFIGMVRGSNRELGNSIILMYVVAILGIADERGWSERSAQQISSIFGADVARINEAAFILLAIIFIVVIVVTYQGKTFDFSNSKADGCLGLASGFAIGILNGYLIAGTLWYYADKYQYPFNLLSGALTPTGQAMIAFLPATIFPNASYWAIPATILMIVRVIR